jgi:hypothetical protein
VHNGILDCRCIDITPSTKLVFNSGHSAQTLLDVCMFVEVNSTIAFQAKAHMLDLAYLHALVILADTNHGLFPSLECTFMV